MELREIPKDEPKFVPRVITHGMPPFEATVAERVDVLHQRGDYHWPLIRDGYNSACQYEERLQRYEQLFKYLTVLGGLVSAITVGCTLYSTFFAHK
jgi:hypothetical protein